MTVIEKMKLLEKCIGEDSAGDDPVVELVMEKLLRRETARMDAMKQRLMEQRSVFETRYGLTSFEFEMRYRQGLMGDDQDFVEWSATNEMMSRLEKKQSLLISGEWD